LETQAQTLYQSTRGDDKENQQADHRGELLIDLTDQLQLYSISADSQSSPPLGVDNNNAHEQQVRLRASKHNEAVVRAVSNNTYRIGSIENAPHHIVTSNVNAGDDSAGVTVRWRSHVNDEVWFAVRASADGYIVIVTVNAGYIPIAMNWFCQANLIQFTNFLILAEDQL